MMTKRQRQIAELAVEYTSREIAKQLFLSIRTVENHLQRIFDALDVHSRDELTEVLRSEVR